MEKFIWMLDENLKSMVAIIGKFLAFLVLLLIAIQVYSPDGSIAYMSYVSMLFSAIIMSMLAGIVIWFAWAIQHCCADRFTILIMSEIVSKVFIAYFVTFGLILSAIIIAVMSGYTQQPTFFIGIVLAVLIGWKIDSYLDAYLSDNIFDDLQT